MASAQNLLSDDAVLRLCSILEAGQEAGWGFPEIPGAALLFLSGHSLHGFWANLMTFLEPVS